MKDMVFDVPANLEIPQKMAGELLEYGIGDNVDGRIYFEVIGKGEDFIRIRVLTINVNQKKRAF